MFRWEKSAALAAAVVSFVPNTAQATLVIGNWENADDGWIDWGTQAAITGPKYTYSSSGATLGSSALLVTQSGYNQDLAIKLEYQPSAMAAFFANKQFQIDVTLPATTSSGWSQIYDFAVNAQGYGFHSLGGVQPVPGAQWGWGSSGGSAQTYTLTFDYSALVDGNSGNGEISPSAGYVEFIFSTNNDGVHNTYLFDNARLTTVPEPASAITLASLSAAPLLARRRRV